MKLFGRNFDRPGPGVNKDEPRKRGAARFFEVLFRDFSDLVKLNFLFLACILPAAAVYAAGLFGFMPALAYLVSLILSFPAGGAAVACAFCVTKLLRDDPGFVWHDFRRKFRGSFRQAMAPGMVCAAIIQIQVLLWASVLLGEAAIGPGWIAAMFLTLLIFAMVSPYVFALFAYVDLNALQTVRNGILLSLANAPRSIAGAVSGGAIWVAFVLFLPFSLFFLPFVAFFGFSLSWLLCFMWVWPPIEKQFRIEETINARRQQ